MEKLVKHTNGQWELIKAWLPKGQEHEAGMLNEHGEKQPHPYATAVGQNNTGSGINAAHSSHLTTLFKQLNDAHSANSHRAADHYHKSIKDLISNAAPGSIDLGHLDRLRDNHKKYVRALPHSSSVAGKGFRGNMDNMFTKHDFIDAASKHIGDVKSLKEVYDKQGIGAVRGLARAHGVNINPYGDNPFFKHKNLQNIAGDTQAFVTGAYGQHKVKPYPSNKLQEGEDTYYDWDAGNGSNRAPNLNAHDKAVDDAYLSYADNEDPNALEDTVLNRGEHTFKYAHGIKG